MVIDDLTSLITGLFSRRTRQQSEPDVSQGLREQIVNIIDDLVDKIAPGYLLPNPYFPFDYRMAIYQAAYKSLWREFGKRRFEDVNYRDEVFDFLREVPSAKFFTVTEHLLKVVCEGVHIQSTRSDDIIPNPSAGNELWSRKESVRDNHIKLFKGVVDIINYRLSQHNAKYCYKLDGDSVQMVRLDTGLDVPEGNSDTQEPDNNQPAEHHQNQNRSEFWNRKHYVIAVIVGGAAFLELAFGDGILIPLFSWLWNYLQTIL